MTMLLGAAKLLKGMEQELKVGWVRRAEGGGCVHAAVARPEQQRGPSSAAGRCRAAGQAACRPGCCCAHAAPLPQGTVRLIFQPAEEGGAGGDLMVKEGGWLGRRGCNGLAGCRPGAAVWWEAGPACTWCPAVA